MYFHLKWHMNHKTHLREGRGGRGARGCHRLKSFIYRFACLSSQRFKPLWRRAAGSWMTEGSEVRRHTPPPADFNRTNTLNGFSRFYNFYTFNAGRCWRSWFPGSGLLKVYKHASPTELLIFLFSSTTAQSVATIEM